MKRKIPAVSWAPGAIVLALALPGCVSGPDFERPELDVGRQFVASGDSEGIDRFATDDVPATRWWREFEDPTLDALVEQALDENLSVETGLARLQQATALADAARGARLPSVQATAQGARVRTSSPNLASVGTDAIEITGYSADLRVSYDLDLFGKRARRAESARARRDEAAYRLQAIRLLVAAEVVTTYIELASLRDEIALREQQIEDQQARLDLLEARRRFGLERGATAIDAAAEVEQLRAMLPSIRQRTDGAVHRLAVLQGLFPAQAVVKKASLAGLKQPVSLDTGIPSQLVRNRPDILAAEARLAAASAEIGVATANLYPDLSIMASGGVAGFEGAVTILEPVWSIGGGILAPLFQGGRLRAEKRAAEANYRAELGEYRGVVLGAFEQVANGLRAFENNSQAVKSSTKAARLAEESHAVAAARFDAGVEAYTSVLLTQRRAQDARIGELRAKASWLSDTALLLSAVAPVEPMSAIVGDAIPPKHPLP
jgi:NodT family efflux transporter outer membrane factor (OMF) lipoprotein